VRTLGRLDGLFYPFFEKEKENAEEMFFDFYREIDTLRAPSNIPFAICGADINGKSLHNELSDMLLDVYRRAGTTNTKFHVLVAESTPETLVKKALNAIREGNNSIVLMNDRVIVDSLLKLGAEREDAVRYHVVGCYECGAEGEMTCTTNGRVNIAKAVEYAINDGIDMLTGKQVGLRSGKHDTFEDFYNEYLRQLEFLSINAMKATDIYEREYRHIHSSPFLSGTYTGVMERGGDVYCSYTAKYNNSSVNAIGLATAVDSLYAIKKLVYEDKTFSLDELRQILINDWEGNEVLRLRVKNRFKKYGNADPEVDVFAADTVKFLASVISGKPNSKGGKYRLGLFSINWRWVMGEYTAASADGRKKGQTLSQNSSASFGADKKGATAHLISAATIDATDTPNASIVDIDLHVSAVRGENGLEALYTSLMTFFEMGGFGVHYNVLDTEVLKRAKESPQDYPNLQVRLCGWNVLFSTLSDKEKDEFIARSVK
jgi:formate C-acetyltransferase